MMGKVVTGVLSIAGFAGAVVAGMELERRLTSNEVQNAEERGRQMGRAEALDQYSSHENLSKVTARLVSEMLKPDVGKVLSEEARTIVAEASEEISASDLLEVAIVLPSSPVRVVPNSCYDVGEELIVSGGDYFDVCGTSETVSVGVVSHYNGYVELSLKDGERRLTPTNVRAYDDNCGVKFLGFEPFEGAMAPRLRIVCEGNPEGLK